MSINPYTHTTHVNIVDVHGETVAKMAYHSSSKAGARRKANKFLAGTYMKEQVEEAINRDAVMEDFDVWTMYDARLTTPV